MELDGAEGARVKGGALGAPFFARFGGALAVAPLLAALVATTGFFFFTILGI
jgi:hypothetical protein